MPSRKRAKGKARKAKAADRHWREVEQYHWKGWATVSSCNHGHSTICPDDDHPVYKYIDELFYIQTGSDGVKHLHVNKEFEDSCRGLWTLLSWVRKSFADHSLVWNNEDHCKMAGDILLSIGTNIILKGAGSIGAARLLANAALLLEKFSSIVEVNNLGDDPDLMATSTEDNCCVNFAVCSAAPMIRDLAGGKDRAVIRFFNKRISCDCLKAKYAESKRSSQKVGACNACRQTFLRTDLMVCGTCRIGQYCSVECQSQAWKDHQDECKFLDLGQDGLQWLTTQEEDAKEVRRKQLIVKCNAI